VTEDRDGAGRNEDPNAAGAARGALALLVIGLILAIAHNALGLQGRPPHGIRWFGEPDSLPPLPKFETVLARGDSIALAPAVRDTVVAGPMSIELATLKKIFDSDGALLLDARGPDEYAEGHLTGAINLPLNDAIGDPDRMRRLDPGDRAIVVYCSGSGCPLSEELAKLLVESGRRKVLVFEAGYPGWLNAGYPVTRGAAPGAAR
jgi:rhodanese-related sulfurtransferase